MARVVPQYTINDLVAADIHSIFISRVNGAVTATASYTITSSNAPNGAIMDQKFPSVTVPIQGAALTALNNFITSNVIPAANTQEGL